MKRDGLTTPDEETYDGPEELAVGLPYHSITSRATAVARNLLPAAYAGERTSLVNRVLFKLWRWASRRPEISLPEADWQRLAAKTTYNEVLRYFRQQRKHEGESTWEHQAAAVGIAGNTQYEVASLSVQIWAGLRQLSLRQRAAIVLHSDDLALYLQDASGVTPELLAEGLQISLEAYRNLRTRLPLSDAEIVQVLRQSGDLAVNSPKQVWEARHKGRAKLARWLAGK